MDLVRLGLSFRALRRRRGWRQVDLAAAAGVSQGLISWIERGHSDRVPLATVMRVASVLEARLLVELRWRGGELDRLLDTDHAGITVAIAELLRHDGWEVCIEVTYAIYRATGSIDVLAWHAATRSLLIVEVKTEITSAESALRKLDEKVRLGGRIAEERFGWRAGTVSRLLAVEDARTARRRIEVHRDLFDATFPARTVAVRRWLRAPAGSLSGLCFLSSITGQRGMSRRGGRHRVRRPSGPAIHPGVSVTRDEISGAEGAGRPTILTAATLHDMP